MAKIQESVFAQVVPVLEKEIEAPAADGAVTTEKLVDVRLRIRAAKSELTKKYEDEKDALTKQEEMIDTELLRRMQVQGVTQIGTDLGTVYRSEEVNCGIADHEAFQSFVRATGDLDFYQARVSTTHVKEFIEAHGSIPPGLNIFREFVARIRKK